MEKFWIRVKLGVPMCYNVPDIMLNAGNARAYCQSQGGNLAVLNTWQKHNDFVNIYYKELLLDQDIWIGLEDKHINTSLIIHCIVYILHQRSINEWKCSL